MSAVILALGLVLVVEGLILALLPGRLEELLRQLSLVPIDARRMLGLGALAVGVGLVWVAKSLA